MHPHYIRVQKYLHALLQQLIFKITWTEEKQRNALRRTTAAAKQTTVFTKNYREVTGEPLGRITRVQSVPRDGVDLSLREPSVDFRDRQVQIDRAHPLLHALRRKTKYLPLVERLVIAFERALKEPSVTRRREVFYRLLIDIFKDI